MDPHAARERTTAIPDHNLTEVLPRPAGRVRLLERRLLAGILALGLVHGLVYILLEPPWEHYEEPSHFEYAWLISHTGRLPQYPAYDQAERRQIAASMIAHGFFARRPLSLPDLNSTDQPIWIGINVTGGVPLYHLLVALPLHLVAGTDVDTQLYVGRLASLGLFVSTIALAYLVLAELVPPGHTLRWAVPAALALLPGFADLMTAINNDVGATFMFSFYLWASVRLVVRGPSLPRLCGVVILAVGCALTKNTILLAVPLTLVAISLAVWSAAAAGRRHLGGGFISPRFLLWALAGLPVLTLFVGLGLALAWGDPAWWYRETTQPTPTRVAAQPPVPGLGNEAIAFTVMPGGPDAGALRQPIPHDRVLALRGQTLTLGAWMWATQPVTVNGPALLAGQRSTASSVRVATQPAFYAWPVSVTADAPMVQVLLQPGLGGAVPRPVTVYYDGVVLAAGPRPAEQPPVFASPETAQGTWGGQPFVNEVRNGSAEHAWPWVRPWAENLVKRLAGAHLSPSTVLGALLDERATGYLYQATAVRLFRTFWGAFAWGNIALPAIGYALLRYGTVLGVFAAAIRLGQGFGRLGRARQLALVWLGVAMLAIWGEVLARGFFTVLDPTLYIPTARYGYAAIIPTVLLLVAGWSDQPWQRVHLDGNWARAQARLSYLWRGIWPAMFLAVFLVLDVVSALTIVSYYSGR